MKTKGWPTSIPAHRQVCLGFHYWLHRFGQKKQLSLNEISCRSSCQGNRSFRLGCLRVKIEEAPVVWKKLRNTKLLSLSTVAEEVCRNKKLSITAMQWVLEEVEETETPILIIALEGKLGRNKPCHHAVVAETTLKQVAEGDFHFNLRRFFWKSFLCDWSCFHSFMHHK
jgi:hypothetical protein